MDSGIIHLDMQKHAQKRFTIGIALTRTTSAGICRFSGIMRYAAERPDWNVRRVREREGIGSPNEIRNLHGIDGIVGGFHSIEGLCHGRRIPPIVTIDSRGFPGGRHAAAAVEIDNGAVGRTAAETLLRNGLRNLAFVGVRQKLETYHQDRRLAAFKACAKDAGVQCKAFIPTEEDPSESDLERLAAFLTALPRPCGVMAYNDGCAQVVMDACHMAHLKVPDQIQIVGVDNEKEICENTIPTLTSVLPDFEGGGYLAAKMLGEMLDGRRKPRSKVLNYYGVKKVVVRASTQDLKGGGRLVTLAREFIRLHAGEKISVKDIAAELKVSRRTLENRFRGILNCGVADVLRDERLEHVASLLRETDRTATEISYDSGFSSPTYLAGLFKRTYGMTMGEWRSGHHI